MMANQFNRYEEHRFSREIPGDVDTVRNRVAEVLEQFNYFVLGGNPLQAKRDRLKNILVAGVLEYRATLTIAFKPISPASTLATFDYSVEYLFTKGDRLTLEREADAVIAQVIAGSRETRCPSCGEENGARVRFCRACGTPLGRTDVPPEVEILRFTAETNAARQELATGLVIGLLTLIGSLAVALLVEGEEWLVLGLGGVGGLIAGFYLLHGLRRLGTFFAPSTKRGGKVDEPPIGLIEGREAIPVHQYSITEGTTELMSAPREGSRDRVLAEPPEKAKPPI